MSDALEGGRVALTLSDEAATRALGRWLAQQAPPSAQIWLRGDLGAGKSVLARAMIRAMGYQGPVPSPSYTLLESYTFPQGDIHHLDLYRLGDAEELEYLGFFDLLAAPSRMVIEWPERAAALLPVPWLDICLQMAGSGRLAQLTFCHSSRVPEIKLSEYNEENALSY